MDNSLIVMESDVAVAEQISDHLKDGFTVYRAGSDNDVFDRLGQSHVQLALIDQGVAVDLNDSGLIQRMRNEFPEVMRVLLAAEDGAKDAEESVNNGLVHRVLSLPVEMGELDMIVADGVANYEEMDKIKKQILQESDEMVANVKTVISQAKDVEKEKREMEQQLEEVKKDARRVQSEMKKKIDTYETEVDAKQKQLDTAMAEKTRFEKKLKQFQANWSKVVGGSG